MFSSMSISPLAYHTSLVATFHRSAVWEGIVTGDLTAQPIIYANVDHGGCNGGTAQLSKTTPSNIRWRLGFVWAPCFTAATSLRNSLTLLEGGAITAVANDVGDDDVVATLVTVLVCWAAPTSSSRLLRVIHVETVVRGMLNWAEAVLLPSVRATLRTATTFSIAISPVSITRIRDDGCWSRWYNICATTFRRRSSAAAAAAAVERRTNQHRHPSCNKNIQHATI